MEIKEKSMYDIVKENLQKRKRKMYVHRLMYIFSYDPEISKQHVSDEEDIVGKFGELVDEANYPDVPGSGSASISLGSSEIEKGEEEEGEPEGEEEEEEKETGRTDHEGGEQFDEGLENMMQPENIYYHDEHLSGILFSYDEPVGIHLLEGSDAMLMKHIESLFKREVKWIETLRNVKLLCTFHHVYKRIVTKWIQIEVVPPVPSQPIEPPVTDEDHCDLYQKCLFMMANVKDYLIFGDSAYNLKERYINRASVGTLMIKLSKLMPSIQLLKHLLNSPILEDLKLYSYRLTVIPKPIPYHEMVWPLPTNHVPDFHDVLMQKGESFYEYTMRMREKH